MSDFTGRYDQTYSEHRKTDSYKCAFADCRKSAVYLSGSMYLCVDHYMKSRV
jgi:hypothetical protein